MGVRDLVPARCGGGFWWRFGLRPDGKKEIIDCRLAVAESTGAWEPFLSGLFRRGLDGRRLEMIGVDGGAGLWATCP